MVDNWQLMVQVCSVTRTCFVDLKVLMSEFCVLMHGLSNVLFWSIIPVFTCEYWSVVRDLCSQYPTTVFTADLSTFATSTAQCCNHIIPCSGHQFV